MASFFRKLTAPATVELELNPSQNPHITQRTITVDEGDREQFHSKKGPITFQVFHTDDPISGRVIITPQKKFDFISITVELIGETATYYDGKNVDRFISLSKELDSQSFLEQKKEFEFEFKSEKEFESYRGINCDLRYYVKVTVKRKMFNMSKLEEFWVKQVIPRQENLIDDGIHMEVGLENIVMLSISYNNVWLNVKDGVIEGILKFFLVRSKIDKCEVTIKRKETTGKKTAPYEEEEVLKKFEIIDGTPAKDEIVPVRFFLKSIDDWRLTPSADPKIFRKYHLQYLIHLALCDTKGRRFFKQKEIKLFRSSDVKKSPYNRD